MGNFADWILKKEEIREYNDALEEFYALQSEKFVNDTFEGSLPAFLAAFGSRKKLSSEEVEELKKVIDEMRG